MLTGASAPSSDPRNTSADPPPNPTGSGTKCSNLRPGLSRTSSGRAIQSCTPWSRLVPGVEVSEWQMPAPAVIRFISPGRTWALLPPESMWETVPSNNQLSVCSPVCGCGATSMPPVADTSSGP